MKEFNLTEESQWACILGGSSGLGLASAKKLARHGLNICLIHRTRRSKMPAFEQECIAFRESGVELKCFNIDALNTDNRAEVTDFFKENNYKLKVLLHSLAKGNLKPIDPDKNDSLTSADIRLTFEAMALSLYDWSIDFVKAGLFCEYGRILSFTSEGSYKSLPNYAAVSSAKAALESITRSLAYELAPHKITANCIQAGVTDTESLNLIPGVEAIKEASQLRNPYQRLTTPADVANVVYLFCKDEANWINGVTIPVDGGEHLR